MCHTANGSHFAQNKGKTGSAVSNCREPSQEDTLNEFYLFKPFFSFLSEHSWWKMWVSGGQQTDSVRHIQYPPKALEERLGYVCVLYLCLCVCAIDDIRGHELVASWYVLPHTVRLKLKTAFGNRRLHMQVQASSFFWNLDESAARATSPRGGICWVRWRPSPFLGVCSAGCHSSHPGASVCPPACTPACPCRSVLRPGPCRRLD